MQIDVKKFVKTTLIPHTEYLVTSAEPATGIVYVINNFISGHVRLRGRSGGQYPYKYLEMIDNLFGAEKNTIEACSGPATGSYTDCVTVDINPKYHPYMIDDAQVLEAVKDNTFSRWRCDPPYNKDTARKMYGSEFPSLSKLLTAGSRVVKPNSLLFLLCPQNRQMCPPSIKRIGLILMTIVPLNEIRCLNIYVKLRKK